MKDYQKVERVVETATSRGQLGQLGLWALRCQVVWGPQREAGECHHHLIEGAYPLLGGGERRGAGERIGWDAAHWRQGGEGGADWKQGGADWKQGGADWTQGGVVQGCAGRGGAEQGGVVEGDALLLVTWDG